MGLSENTVFLYMSCEALITFVDLEFFLHFLIIFSYEILVNYYSASILPGI